MAAFAPLPLTRDELNSIPGDVVVIFGTNWCGYCNRFKPAFEKLLEQHQDVQSIWVEDGTARPLGRSFRVKFWPTLVFMRNGEVVQQIARPTEDDAATGFAALNGVQSERIQDS